MSLDIRSRRHVWTIVLVISLFTDLAMTYADRHRRVETRSDQTHAPRHSFALPNSTAIIFPGGAGSVVFSVADYAITPAHMAIRLQLPAETVAARMLCSERQSACESETNSILVTLPGTLIDSSSPSDRRPRQGPGVRR